MCQHFISALAGDLGQFTVLQKISAHRLYSSLTMAVHSKKKPHRFRNGAFKQLINDSVKQRF